MQQSKACLHINDVAMVPLSSAAPRKWMSDSSGRTCKSDGQNQLCGSWLLIRSKVESVRPREAGRDTANKGLWKLFKGVRISAEEMWARWGQKSDKLHPSGTASPKGLIRGRRSCKDQEGVAREVRECDTQGQSKNCVWRWAECSNYGVYHTEIL